MPRFVDKIGEWYQFPLGLPYVSSSMKAAGFNVFTLNLNNEDDVEEALRRKIYEYNIDVVMTGGLVVEYYTIRRIFKLSKRIKPDIITIAGGGIVTAAPVPSMIAMGFADFGIIGEGEVTSCELCRAIEEKTDYKHIKGIIYPDKAYIGNYIQTRMRESIENIDSIPFPDYSGFGIDKILSKNASVLGINKTGVVSILTGRSCPCLCTFCFHNMGNRYRQRSLDNVFEEIDFLMKSYPVNYLFIVDECFGSNKNRVVEFCKRIKPYGIGWRVQYRVTDITKEIAENLKASNCDIVSFGIESADNSILKSMKKHITIEQTEKALKLCVDAGLGVQGGFIFGDVEETIYTAKKTINWWKEHEEYALGLDFITVYPGTYLYNYAVNNGIISNEAQYIKDGCPAVNVSKMTSEQIAWLAEQINTLQLKAQKLPRRIYNIEYDYAGTKISFDYECYKCGAENHLDNVRLLISKNHAICKICGQKHCLSVPNRLANIVNDNILALQKKYKKIALWGMTDFFCNFSEKLSSVKPDTVFFIDGSPLKQGSLLYGKIIHDPNILNAEGIELVIISATSYLTVIREQIALTHHSVKKIISLVDILNIMDISGN
jgi:radical SAM superfamily enzyme YgiQ (UPF0313 family)